MLAYTHRRVCQCLSCWLSRSGNSNKRHFAPKWLLTLFQCCHVFFYLSTLTNGRQCYVSVPNNEQVRFSHEVFVVGIHVNASSKMSCFNWITNTILHHTHLHVCCGLTLFHLLFAVEPPSDLKFKILNENTVEMSWARPSARIDGFKIQVVSDAG